MNYTFFKTTEYRQKLHNEIHFFLFNNKRAQKKSTRWDAPFFFVAKPQSTARYCAMRYTFVFAKTLQIIAKALRDETRTVVGTHFCFVLQYQKTGDPHRPLAAFVTPRRAAGKTINPTGATEIQMLSKTSFLCSMIPLCT